MKCIVYKHTAFTLFLFLSTVVFSQIKYDHTATPASISLEGKQLTGYTTHFDFSRENVRKGWWEYARKFGSPLNMKTYYKVTVPSEMTDGNIDLEIFTQTTADESGGSAFFLGLENGEYKEQALLMIVEFKKHLYIQDITKKIEQKQLESHALSQAYHSAILDTDKTEILEKLMALEREIEHLKKQMIGIVLQ